MENKGYWKTSLKIVSGFMAIVLMAFVSTRHTPVKKNTADGIPVPVNKNFNVLQFYDVEAIQPLLAAWEGHEKISIVHTGDSHIQPDFFTQQTRKNLQALKGDGGIGLVFPFSTAKTYSSCAYTSRHTGEWTFAKSFILPAKIPLGVGGMACKTNDKTATFEISFKQPTVDTLTQITLFYNYQKTACSVKLSINGQVYTVNGKDYSDRYPQLTVPGKINSIHVSLVNETGSGVPFEFYGMSVEAAGNTGLVYHAAGVGGAQYKAILYQKLFAQQLKVLQPQLVVIDYGTNDYLYDDEISPTLEKEMQQVINTIKEAVPSAGILLTTAQDLYWKKRNCKSAVRFGKMVRELARKNHCMYYDWFNVSGGQGAILKWKEKGYAQADLIHLTKKGYELKGDLLSEAITNSLDRIKNQPGLDSLMVPAGNTMVAEEEPEKTSGIQHVIQKGETLGGIAKKYGVKVEELQSWNNLEGDRINAGESLVIRR